MEGKKAQEPQGIVQPRGVVEEPRSGASNFWQSDGEMRAIWKLLVFGGIFIASLIIIGISSVAVGADLADNWINAPMMLVACLVTTFVLVVGVERQPFLSIGLRSHPGWLRQFWAGMLYACALILLLFFLELITDRVSIHYGQATVGKALVVFLSGFGVFLFVGFSEEILIRGYPLQLIFKKSGQWTALLLTAIVFSLMHAMNPAITLLALFNIALAGLLLGSAWFVTRSLWLPIGIHTAWNLVQGTVLGFPVSGMPDASVFVVIDYGPAFLTGGDFGPEGGILASLMLIVGTALLYYPPFADLLRGSAGQQSVIPEQRNTETSN